MTKLKPGVSRVAPFDYLELGRDRREVSVALGLLVDLCEVEHLRERERRFAGASPVTGAIICVRRA